MRFDIGTAGFDRQAALFRHRDAEYRGFNRRAVTRENDRGARLDTVQ